MPRPIQFRHKEPYPADEQTNMPAVRSDIMERDTVFVYRVRMKKDSMGAKYEVWDSKPIPAKCSFQEHALDSQHTDANNKGSRFVRLYTRDRDFFYWHDKVVARGVDYQVEKVLDHFDNYSGVYHHTEVRLIFLEDNNPDAVKQA